MSRVAGIVIRRFDYDAHKLRRMGARVQFIDTMLEREKWKKKATG